MSKASKNKLFEQITDMSNKIYEHRGKANHMAIISASPKARKLLDLAIKKKRKERNKARRKMLLDSLEDAHNWYCPECKEQCQPFKIPNDWRFIIETQVWGHCHGPKRVVINGARKL